MGTLSKLKRVTRVLPLSILTLLLAGWTHELYAPVTPPQASQHLVQKYEEAEQDTSDFYQLHLDLSDDRDWAFLRGRLQAAGKGVHNAPELFQRLDYMRMRAQARKAGGDISGGRQNNPTSPPNWCNHFFLWKRQPVSRNGVTTFYPAAQASCKDGADYVYLDMVNFNEDEEGTQSTRISSRAAEEYGGGLAMRVSTVASLPTDSTRVLRMESLLMAVGATLEQTTFIVQRASAIERAPSFSFTHPRKIHTPTMHSEIIACQLRGGADCDYAVAGYSGDTLVPYPARPTGVAAANPNESTLNPDDYWAFGAPYNYNKLYVPVRGTLSAGSSSSTQCIFRRFDRARIQLIAVGTGRTCLNEATFLNSLVPGSNTTNVNVLTNMSNLFNTAGAGTSPASCATETILNEMTRFHILITGRLKCGNKTRRFVATYPTAEDINNDRTDTIFFRNR